MVLNCLSTYIGSIVLAFVVLSVLSLLTRLSAAFRHQVLVGFFVSLALLPLATFLLPSWSASGVPPPTALYQQGPQSIEESVGSPEWMKAREGRVQAKRFNREQHSLPSRIGNQIRRFVISDRPLVGSRALLSLRHAPLVALIVWAAGCFVVLIIQLTRWAGAGFIAEMATLPDRETPNRSGLETIENAGHRIAMEVGLRYPVPILRSDIADIAMAWGLRNPCIVLPSDVDDWSIEKREGVLRHELSHIKRGDNIIQVIIIAICALYWMNPLVWVALRLLHFEREVACDDLVLRYGTVPSTYAKHLMEITMKLKGPKSKSIVPAVMAHSSDLKRRLHRVLDPKTNRTPLSRVSAASIILAVVLVALPISSMRLWSEEVGNQSPLKNLWSKSRAAILESKSDTFADLYFNGSNSHVVVPDSDEFDFQGSFTLEASVNVANLDESGQNMIILSKHRSHVQDAGEWSWLIMGPPNPTGRIQFNVWSGETSYSAASDPGVILPSGVHCSGWQDLAFSYSADTHAWRIFVDGQIVGSGSNFLDIGQTDREVWIGWESNEPSHDFYGWIREIRISDSYRYDGPYDPALPLQVDSNTIAYWTFDEGEGTTLNDVSGNGHNGLIQNGSWDSCLGDEIEVEPGTNLQTIVDAAPDGASITLLPGIHTGPVVIAGRDLTLCGSGADVTTLDANFYDYAVLAKEGAQLHLCDMRIVNCFNDDPEEYYYPAALTVDSGNVDVLHCLFENNLNAIAAWHDNSQVLVEETTVLTGDAFAFITRIAESSTAITIENCTVTGIREDQDHGLIKMWGGSVSMYRSILHTPGGRAIEYHTGTWEGDCNIIFATTQVGGGLVLPPNHWNIDPRLCDLDEWSYRVFPESPALPGNNDCGVLIGSGSACATSVRETDWSTLKRMY